MAFLALAGVSKFPSPITGIDTAFITFSNSVTGSFPLVYSVYPTKVVPTISNLLFQHLWPLLQKKYQP